MNPRGGFVAKVAAGAAASLTGLIVAAPLLTGDKEGVPPALAADVVAAANAESAPAEVKGGVSYVQFDVQLSEEEGGSFVVEVHPGAYVSGGDRCRGVLAVAARGISYSAAINSSLGYL